MNDPELNAMSTVAQALDPLDEAAQTRIVRWIVDRFELQSVPHRANHNKGSKSEDSLEDSDLAALFSLAQPKPEWEKVLVAAFWMKECQGHSEFDAQSLNGELKELGYGIGNITRALQALIDQKPQLIIQCRKSGTTKQARKRYRLTAVGAETARKLMLRSKSDIEAVA